MQTRSSDKKEKDKKQIGRTSPGTQPNASVYAGENSPSTQSYARAYAQATNYCSRRNQAYKEKTQRYEVHYVIECTVGKFAGVRESASFVYRTEAGARSMLAHIEETYNNNYQRLISAKVVATGVCA